MELVRGEGSGPSTITHQQHLFSHVLLDHTVCVQTPPACPPVLSWHPRTHTSPQPSQYSWRSLGQSKKREWGERSRRARAAHNLPLNPARLGLASRAASVAAGCPALSPPQAEDDESAAQESTSSHFPPYNNPLQKTYSGQTRHGGAGTKSRVDEAWTGSQKDDPLLSSSAPVCIAHRRHRYACPRRAGAYCLPPTRCVVRWLARGGGAPCRR